MQSFHFILKLRCVWNWLDLVSNQQMQLEESNGIQIAWMLSYLPLCSYLYCICLTVTYSYIYLFVAN